MRKQRPKILSTIITAAVIASAFVVPAAIAAPAVSHTSPKLANFYLRWTISENEARELAHWDVVILDMEVQGNSPNEMRLMRQINPNIKILAYVPASEVRIDSSAIGIVAPLRRDLFASIPDSWFVKDAVGNRRSFWTGTWIVNITDQAPVVNGQRWNTYLPRFVSDRILSTGMWDGVMYDNGWENITFFAGGLVDLNRDGRSDSASVSDSSWREGLRTIFRNTRALRPDMLVLENDGAIYSRDVHGLQFENFPNGGWSRVVGRVVEAAGNSITPRIVIINANTANSGNKADYQKLRYGLTSALLVDTYYGFDFGDKNHGQTWWYDEYNAPIGAPGPAPTRVDGRTSYWTTGVWRRDYARGVVLVNSGSAQKTVSLGGDFEHLRGSQDPGVNSGRIVRSVTIPGRDGRILIRPLGEVRGAAFENGSFVRIFNTTGQVKRNGFFVFADRFSGSTTLLTRVVSGKNYEIVAAEGPYVRVYTLDYTRKLADFAPYGTGFRGGIAVDIADLAGDGSARIVTATRDYGGAVIKVFTLTGRLEASFHAFDPRFDGGASVAIGDVTGDGEKEIIVGAGKGGGPHVRIFDRQGNLIHTGFFAYAPDFRGGINVVAGDINSDGKDEIVTGAGKGGGPHVRIFDSNGRVLGQFFAFDQNSRSGVRVGVADVDSDGELEILAFSKDLTELALPIAPVPLALSR